VSDHLLNAEKPLSDPWPNLVALDMPDLPELSSGCLPAWAGEFAQALSQQTESPEELSIGLVLASLAAAAARR